MQSQVKKKKKRKTSLNKKSGFSFALKLLIKAFVKASKTIWFPYLKDLLDRFFRSDIGTLEMFITFIVMGILEFITIRSIQFTLNTIRKFK